MTAAAAALPPARRVALHLQGGTEIGLAAN